MKERKKKIGIRWVLSLIKGLFLLLPCSQQSRPRRGLQWGVVLGSTAGKAAAHLGLSCFGCARILIFFFCARDLRNARIPQSSQHGMIMGRKKENQHSETYYLPRDTGKKFSQGSESTSDRLCLLVSKMGWIERTESHGSLSPEIREDGALRFLLAWATKYSKRHVSSLSHLTHNCSAESLKKKKKKR